MNTLVGISVAGILGTNLVSRLSNTVLQGGMDLLIFIKSGSHSDTIIKTTNEQIEEMDLFVKIKILEKIIKKVEKTEKEIYLIEGIEDIILKCICLINEIKTEIELHNNKLFHRYRSFDVSSSLYELNKYNIILKNRIEMIN